MLEVLIGAAMLVVLTLGGAIDWLHEEWARLAEPGVWHGVALIVSALVLLALVDLPLTLYRTFVIEQRYGFNRMTARLFVADLAKQTLVAAALGVPLLALVLWLMQRMGSLWWLYVWL